jgi:aryl-alcohol dehydrogenase-like predicted oxidoreductase
VIVEKLWWEFWPSQTAAQELDASLERTGLEYVDFLYSDPPPELPLERVVAEVTDLIAAGRIRAWGIVNWPADRLLEAASIAAAPGRAGAVRGAAAVLVGPTTPEQRRENAAVLM